MLKQITAQEYSWYLGCSVQNVRKHFKKTGLKNLPDIRNVVHFSRFYLFEVDKNLQIPIADPNRRRR